jgi:DNA mismatch endonuclease (patch repair protein)
VTDTYSAEVRSRVMRRVKGRDTAPEMALRRALYRAGVRGWRCHRTDLPGKPDLAFGRVRLAVFVDGGFWHGHPSKYWPGRSGGYWDAKIARNQARDRKADADLAASGWRCLRMWDFEIERDADGSAERVRELVCDMAKGGGGHGGGGSLEATRSGMAQVRSSYEGTQAQSLSGTTPYNCARSARSASNLLRGKEAEKP